MSTQLHSMILSQPSVLRAASALDVQSQVAILRQARRIFVVGTGTSFHAAELGAFLLRGRGIDALAVQSIEYGRGFPVAEPGDAVIVISHTGSTAFARAARADALDRKIPLVTITGESAGWGEAIIVPTRELSETYTASYTGALAVLGLLGHALTGSETGAEHIRWAADQIEQVISSPSVGHIEAPARALAIIGPGPWAVTAKEGALKIREAAHILAEGFDPERLLHGAAVPLEPGDMVIALQPDADPDGLTAGLVDAANDEHITTFVLHEQALPAHPFTAQIVAVVRLQLLASQFTDEKGTNPDTAITGAWARDRLWTTGAPLTS